jgi:hypothetical protein
MSGDVLRRHARRTLGESLVVTGFVFGSEFALGMSVQIGAIDAEDKHQQHLGVHARRADVGRFQTIDCRSPWKEMS